MAFNINTVKARPIRQAIILAPRSEPVAPAREQEATADPRLLAMRPEDADRRFKRQLRRTRKLTAGGR